MKRWMVCGMAVLLLLLVGILPAMAVEPFIRTEAIREEPVNLLSYTASGLDFVSEVVARLIKSGKPSVVFGEHVKGAVEVTFVERLLNKNVNLVGGMTLKNEEPSNFVWGFQYTGWRAKTGGVWDIFSKLEPTVYNERGEWFLGLAYAWKD